MAVGADGDVDFEHTSKQFCPKGSFWFNELTRFSPGRKLFAPVDVQFANAMLSVFVGAMRCARLFRMPAGRRLVF